MHVADRDPRLDLPADEVHLWRIALDAEPAPPGAWLSPDEQQRAAKFHFDRDRRRWSCARAGLRAVLGRYLGAHPAALRFVYDAYGKPSLGGGVADAPHFSLSHSADLAVVAVGRTPWLGVDIEWRRPCADALAIARRYFARSEYLALERLAPADRLRGFYACWTRKEAYLKAVGRGLSEPLDGFEVSVAPDEPPRLLAVDGSTAAAAPWRLYLVEPAPGYSGTLAVRADGRCRPLWRDHPESPRQALSPVGI